MQVGVDGDVYAGVAETLRHDLRMDASPEHHCGVGMSEPVDPMLAGLVATRLVAGDDGEIGGRNIYMGAVASSLLVSGRT